MRMAHSGTTFGSYCHTLLASGEWRRRHATFTILPVRRILRLLGVCVLTLCWPLP